MLLIDSQKEGTPFNALPGKAKMLSSLKSARSPESAGNKIFTRKG
jgi:hypothetical protein